MCHFRLLGLLCLIGIDLIKLFPELLAFLFQLFIVSGSSQLVDAPDGFISRCLGIRKNPFCLFIGAGLDFVPAFIQFCFLSGKPFL